MSDCASHAQIGVRRHERRSSGLFEPETYSSHGVLNQDLGGIKMQDPSDPLSKARRAVTGGAAKGHESTNKHMRQQGRRVRYVKAPTWEVRMGLG